MTTNIYGNEKAIEDYIIDNQFYIKLKDVPRPRKRNLKEEVLLRVPREFVGKRVEVPKGDKNNSMMGVIYAINDPFARRYYIAVNEAGRYIRKSVGGAISVIGPLRKFERQIIKELA